MMYLTLCTQFIAAPRIMYHAAHRWKYAIGNRVLEEKFLYNRELGLGVCGDWCGGPRVEGAFLSGYHLANAVVSDAPQEAML